ncbi:MAG: hypothetical protein R6U51_00745 [Anaerolineales bacterium]
MVDSIWGLVEGMGDPESDLQRSAYFSCLMAVIVCLVIANGAEDPLMKWVGGGDPVVF